MYRRLSRAWGPQHWWPAATPFEVICGAILTQNTSWNNVERALSNLRAAKALSVTGVRRLTLAQLQRLVRPSGYFRQKAQRLKGFVRFLDRRFGGSVRKMFSTPTEGLRRSLLELNGIGPETADAILLYAGHHESFVVDTYARRILHRHGVVPPSAIYDDIRQLVQLSLQEQRPVLARAPLPLQEQHPSIHKPSVMSLASRTRLAQVYNEMHGLLVQVGKHYCLKRIARCELCPLGTMLSSPIGNHRVDTKFNCERYRKH